MERVDYESLLISELLQDRKSEALEVAPWYQRRSVWKNPQKAYLINTIFEGKPIPSIYVRHVIDLDDEKSVKEIVDGQQRVRSVLEYRDGLFAAKHPDHDNKYIKYGDYPLASRKRMWHTMPMSTKAPTLRQFQKQFPTEESCLDHLMRTRYGDRHDCEKCGRNAHFYRVKTRKVYSCEYCGAQIAPMAGTPFERTRTPLCDWFFVMFMFTTSRNGVAAKEVERQLGVTYKTAWRMCHEIRKYMASVDGDGPLGGPFKTVQCDETFIGGYERGAMGGAGKTVVFGMKERGGEIICRVVPNRRRLTLQPVIAEHVKRYSEVHTDEWLGYSALANKFNGYWHKTVNHDAGEYVSRKSGATVNAIEGFWAQLKRGINGTHIHVSAKHLPKYLGEFEFRHNRRHRPATMLAELMLSFAR